MYPRTLKTLKIPLLKAPLCTKYREVVRLLELMDGESAVCEDFGGGDALVEEMLDEGAGDSGEEELGSKGEMVELGDIGGFHFSEVVGLAREFPEIFAGGPGDFAGDLVDLVRNFVHGTIITYRGGDGIMGV